MGKDFARFSTFARGQIVAMRMEGAKPEKIRKAFKKKNGRTANLRAIDDVLAHAQADPSWEGENSSAGGHSRPTMRAQ